MRQKRSNNTNIEDLEKFQNACHKVVEKCKNDPEFLDEFLRDIGYYKMKDQEFLESEYLKKDGFTSEDDWTAK